MDCPSCGGTNASDRVECQFCEALLVDVFEPKDERTDPIVGIGGVRLASFEEERDPGGSASFAGSLAPTQYTGDLPRLFRFGDRYQVLEKLGEGGMGRVYKALDLELDRPVALKTIRAERGTGPEVLKRFKQELVLARKITHKNVVRIYDLGEAEGMKFFTMELVEGKSLRDVQRERTTLPVKDAVSYFKQMLAGLAEAHRQGVVHRDLKPQNIMVDGDGLVRIMDFGIARTADTATLTGTSEMMGTPDYISPEQVKGEIATAQSDLFSVGVILYELLTGEVPFKGDTAISKVVARLQVKPPAPRTLRPEIPAHLERIVLKLMEVDPDLRYKTAEEVLQDLEREQVDRSLPLRIRKALGRHRAAAVFALLAASTAVGAWYYERLPEGAASADVPATTIAVLPFHNVMGSSELDWMASGIPEMLVTDISQWASLRPLLPERIHRVLDDLGQRGQTTFDERTLEVISEMTRADYSLHGRFVESGGRLRFDLTLRDSATGVATPIKVDGSAAEVFTLVDAITERVSKELNLTSFFESNRPIAEVSTPSLEAFRAYQAGVFDLQNGRNQSAIPALQKAVSLDPMFTMAHARLAEAYANLGESATAKKSIEIAIGLAADKSLPLVERFQIHAIAARINEDPDTALEAYRKLAEFFPTDPDIQLGLARAFEAKGDIASALESYQAVLETNPSYGAALFGMGRMLVVAERSAEALPLLQKALQSGSFEEDLESLGMLHSILGVAYRSTSDHLKAIEHFKMSLDARRSAGDRRGEITTLVNLSISLRKLRRFENASHSLTEAVEAARESRMPASESFALLGLGNLAFERGQLDEALLHYRTSVDIEWELKRDDEIGIRLNAMAEVYRLRGLYVDALVYLEQAKTRLEREDDSAERAFNLSVLGQIQRARGEYDEAVQAFLLAIPPLEKADRYRDLASARAALAAIYVEQGRFGEATSVLGQGLSYFREEAGANLAMMKLQNAEFLIEVGDVARAEEELPSVVELVPGLDFEGRPRYEYVVGRLLAPDRPAEAEKRLAAAARETNWRDAHLAGEANVARGRILVESGRIEEGKALLKEAIVEAKRLQHRAVHASAALALAEAETAAGNVAEAEALLVEAKELATGFSGRLLLARIYCGLETTAKARSDSAAAEKAANEKRALLKWIARQVPPGHAKSFQSVAEAISD